MTDPRCPYCCDTGQFRTPNGLVPCACTVDRSGPAGDARPIVAAVCFLVTLLIAAAIAPFFL